MPQKSIQETLSIQEQEYDIPYHWMQDRNLGILSKLRTSLVLEMAGEVQGKRVLDFGCGDGKFCSHLCEQKAGTVTGIDISERAIHFAKKLVPCAQFAVAASPSLPFENGSLDVVFCLDVLEHIPDEQLSLWLKEIHRVLASRGKLVISIPSKNKNLDQKHFRHYTPQELQQTLGAYFSDFRFQGYFAKLPLLPVQILDTLYNRRFLWHLFSPLMKRCALEKALYFTAAGIKIDPGMNESL